VPRIQNKLGLPSYTIENYWLSFVSVVNVDDCRQPVNTVRKQCLLFICRTRHCVYITYLGSHSRQESEINSRSHGSSCPPRPIHASSRYGTPKLRLGLQAYGRTVLGARHCAVSPRGTVAQPEIVQGADPTAGGARVEAPSGVESGEGCPLPSRLRGLGERLELTRWGPERSPVRKRIYCIFQATERFSWKENVFFAPLSPR